MQRMRATCGACFWNGTVLTGWVPYGVAKRLLAHVPSVLEDPARRRARGGQIQVRVRLKTLACPKCGESAVQRAVDPADVERLVRQVHRGLV